MADKFFDDDDDETVEDTSTPFKELRARERQLAKDNKALVAQLKELQEFKQTYESNLRTETAAEVFKRLELPAAQAKAFVKLNPDVEVTEESVRAYAVEYGLAVAAPAEEAPAEESPVFKPVSVGGSSPVKATLKYEEYQTLLAENPTAALQAVADGRVEGLMHSDKPDF